MSCSIGYARYVYPNIPFQKYCLKSAYRSKKPFSARHRVGVPSEHQIVTAAVGNKNGRGEIKRRRKHTAAPWRLTGLL